MLIDLSNILFLSLLSLFCKLPHSHFCNAPLALLQCLLDFLSIDIGLIGMHIYRIVFSSTSQVGELHLLSFQSVGMALESMEFDKMTTHASIVFTAITFQTLEYWSTGPEGSVGFQSHYFLLFAFMMLISSCPSYIQEVFISAFSCRLFVKYLCL